MGKKSRIFLIIIPLMLFSLISLNLFNNTQGAINNSPLELNFNNINLQESSQIKGKIENVSSFKIELFQPEWRINNIEFNFSNIRLDKEIKTLEDQANDHTHMYYSNSQKFILGLNTPLILTKKTTIFGIYIYGYLHPDATTENITFQVRDYDTSISKPYGNIYKTTDLNISTSAGWYFQDFNSNPLTLDEGNYSLIINGTERSYLNGDITVYWYHNAEAQPLTPDLPYGEYSKDVLPADWVIYENKTLLYKVVQSYNKSFYPEEINLTVEINQNVYEINNDSISGLGHLNTTCNLSLFDQRITTSINTLNYFIVNFTLNYMFNLTRIKVIIDTVTIEDNVDVQWNFEFSVNRTIYYNYQIDIDFSLFDWNFVSIFRDDVNITTLPSILISNNTLKILNSSIITDESNWKIEATASQINLSFEFPESLNTIKAGTDLEFSMITPLGDITIKIFNPNGFERNNSIIEDVSGLFEYTYLIPQNSHEGLWELLIFWNNQTHGAAISQIFTVFVPELPFKIDPVMLVGIIVAIVASIIVGISGYQGIRVTKRRYDEKKKNLLNVFDDIMNIKYLIVSEKTSGLNLYEKKIGTGKQDALLISGYLNAISKFEIAFTDSDSLSQSIKLEYQESKILMSDFKGFRITLIIKKNPSKYIIDSIKALSYEIDENFGKAFKNFNGTTAPFKGLGPLVEKNLRLYLIYPFQISELKADNIKLLQKSILNRARELLQTMEHFYIVHLIPENIWNYRNLKTVLKLIDKGVFVPDMSKHEIIKK